MKQLSSIDPFAGPGKALQFLALANKVRQSGFTVAQLSYLYRNLDDPAASLAGPDRARSDALLQTLNEGLRRIADESKLVPDPMGELLAGKLTLLPPPAGAVFWEGRTTAAPRISCSFCRASGYS